MVLNAAFIVALLFSLLKCAEMALRPHQKKAFQAAIEDFTLRFDDAWPSYGKWIANLGQVPADAVLIAGAAIFFGAAITVTKAQSDTLVIIGLLVVYFSLLLIDAGAYWHYAPQILNSWAPKESSVRGALSVLWGLLVGFVLLIGLKLVGALTLLVLLAAGRRRYFQLVTFPAFMATAASAFVFLWLFKPVVRLLLAVLWRIAEYQHGAWAAVLFITTAVLGVLKVFW